MSGNVVALPVKSRLELRHNTTPEQMRAMVRDLALWMYDHGVSHLSILRDDKKALITIDGEPL